MGSPLTEFLIVRILTAIENEASLLTGVYHQIDDLEREMNTMKSFLEDANRKVELTEGEKTWVSDVRDIAYDVEDVIEEFLYHINKHQNKDEVTKFFIKTLGAPKHIWVRRQLASKLEDLSEKIVKISRRHKRYAVEGSEGTSSQQNDTNWVKHHAEASLFTKDDHLVGIEDEKQKLGYWLVNGEPQRTVISVFGMGGSGKTTLAAKTYEEQVLRRCFDCYAWITVSQVYVIEDLFRNMIHEFFKEAKEDIPMDLNNKSYKQLVEFLVNYLQPKKYLVVLDDVWNTRPWTEISVALPDGIDGSRIILTTRFENVAFFAFGAGSKSHQVKPLEEKESWDLFCMKAFSHTRNKQCPWELEKSARHLAKKCNGLPLAIVALGGLMSSRNLESEWETTCRRLNTELGNNPELGVVKSILLLSYNGLPYPLKHCFLYCCIFPEDHEIKRKKIIKLWIAEGFVQQVNGTTEEEEAEWCLLELIRRSMLHAVDRNASGRPKRCKMHDIMRELALSIAKTERFSVYFEEGLSNGKEIQARRLSIQGNVNQMRSFQGTEKLRSLFVFAADKMSSSSLNSILPDGIRLLRVLDLEDAPIDKLPSEVFILFNLRYLNLRRTKLKELPNSIGKLYNLETLDIFETEIKVLPAEIANLHNLQSLIMGHVLNYRYGVLVPSDVCKLKKLYYLACVEAKGGIVKQLMDLTQLTTLGITEVRQADGKDLGMSIQRMTLLRALYVRAAYEEPLLIEPLSKPPPNLNKLELIGELEKIPEWFYSLHSLTFLGLAQSKLRHDPLPFIQELSNLTDLHILDGAYEGNELCFRSGFKKLKRLHLHNLAHLSKCSIKKGVMAGVQQILINACLELKKLPTGMEHLTDLQDLSLINLSAVLVGRIRGGVDRSMVRHITKITHFFKTQTGSWSTENLSYSNSYVQL